MKNKKMIKNTLLFILLAGTVLLSSCRSVQTTSGKSYLASYPEKTGYRGDDDIDREVREVAAVEPLLRFPARIGLARIYNGVLTNIPNEEMDKWMESSDNLGDSFGKLITVSPLIADMVSGAPLREGRRGRISPAGRKEVIRKIRLGAARQHIDAVWIYEVFSKTSNTTLPTSLANWTIIGAYIIPSERAETVGFANAILLDVRNGYPYAVASASVKKSDYMTFIGHRDKRLKLEEKNQIASAIKLVPEVEKAMRELKAELSSLASNKRDVRQALSD